MVHGICVLRWVFGVFKHPLCAKKQVLGGVQTPPFDPETPPFLMKEKKVSQFPSPMVHGIMDQWWYRGWG